jgi:glutathione S-transferase
MSVVIYGIIGSRASRCLWTAEELGIAYEWQKISHRDGSSRSAAFLAINPSGKVPALTDGPIAMSESFAINHYLATTYGAGTLWPADPALQAQILQWSFWSATEVEYYIGAIFVQKFFKSDAERDHALLDRLLAEMTGKFTDLEARLADGRDYILGDFTLADIQVAVQALTIIAQFGHDFASLPHVRAWAARCLARPARQKIVALATPAH